MKGTAVCPGSERRKILTWKRKGNCAAEGSEQIIPLAVAGELKGLRVTRNLRTANCSQLGCKVKYC